MCASYNLLLANVIIYILIYTVLIQSKQYTLLLPLIFLLSLSGTLQVAIGKLSIPGILTYQLYL
jgi:hypothetical protein